MSNIKIKMHGHQFYSEIKGKVLLWCQTVEKFEDSYFQVPCVIVQGDNSIEVIPLNADTASAVSVFFNLIEERVRK